MTNEFKTPDGHDLYSSKIWKNEWDFIDWISKFSLNEIGGKFNLWRCPTKWPRKRWDIKAMVFAAKLIYRKKLYSDQMWFKGRKAERVLEKMRYYYAN